MMTNPPDFVMYVVMVKTANAGNFDPEWCPWAEAQCGRYAMGFQSKRDAAKACRHARVRYGKKNAYVQQYGPYS
jgi:hypothetical protein